MITKVKLPKPGTVIDETYRVLDKPPFCGLAPYAEIVGPVNAGVEVILARWPYRKEANPDG